MKITILCSDASHPVNAHLYKWMQQNREFHEISLIRHRAQLPGGDLLFLVSCAEFIRISDRQVYRFTLVLHASDLPIGRGWSPHVWEIINGAEQITVTLLEAADQIDSGCIWKKITFPIPKHFLWDEINNLIFAAEIELIDLAVRGVLDINPEPQAANINPTYLRRRTPKDSELNPDLSITEQFDLIRICDPDRYPAYFILHGQRFKLILEKLYDASPDKD
jgi:methionyl-tRNA formyltransferase